MGASFKFENTIKIPEKLQSDNLFPRAQEKAAISMLDWMSSGSQGSAKKPPIRTGILASSGSVFYKNKFLKKTKDVRTKEAKGPATPNKEHSSKNITWGFNTDYAKRMHDDKNLKPGPFSRRDSNMSPGNLWLTTHLQKDKDNYTALIAAFIKGKMK